MSDFPELEDFSGAQAGTDPSSDFLARERALLGDEFGEVSQDYQNPSSGSNLVNESDEFGIGSYSVGGGGISMAPPQVWVTGHQENELSAFEDQYPDLSNEASQPPTVSDW